MFKTIKVQRESYCWLAQEKSIPLCFESEFTFFNATENIREDYDREVDRGFQYSGNVRFVFYLDDELFTKSGYILMIQHCLLVFIHQILPLLALLYFLNQLFAINKWLLFWNKNIFYQLTVVRLVVDGERNRLCLSCNVALGGHFLKKKIILYFFLTMGTC